MTNREYRRSTINDEDCITIGIDKGNPIIGLFNIRWVKIFDEYCPRLECYDDGWEVLNEFKDLLEIMAGLNGQNISRSDFCKMLDELDIIDKTD